MSVTIAEQTSAFLWSLAMGAGIALFYDAFRIFRLAVKCSTFFIFLQDLVFWCASAAGSFVFLFFVNAGQPRWFLFAGGILGAILYSQTAGALLMGSARAIIAFLRRVFGAVGRFFARPLHALAQRRQLRAAARARRRKKSYKTFVKHFSNAQKAGIMKDKRED
ncbi:spore cortex biosynthesis protein YabQ [Feifania hominis]|uniref:Spore cortex biosynthesis protein YabQ n=1 Tax=Feifania hominis TaxID=2763660 RepID=A0A926DEK5_9FIRM|nr:spore cortex biosynthesis protein YabQ [Feifania hominis]